jgi:hypothetical protein
VFNSLGERRAPPMRGLADGADGPVGGYPLSRGVGQYVVKLIVPPFSSTEVV